MIELAPGVAASSLATRSLGSLLKSVAKAVIAPAAKAVAATVAKVIAPIAAVIPASVKSAVVSVVKAVATVAVAEVSNYDHPNRSCLLFILLGHLFGKL
jgi:hypothetical protein